jgi:hypothetical protein
MHAEVPYVRETTDDVVDHLSVGEEQVFVEEHLGYTLQVLEVLEGIPFVLALPFAVVHLDGVGLHLDHLVALADHVDEEVDEREAIERGVHFVVCLVSADLEQVSEEGGDHVESRDADSVKWPKVWEAAIVLFRDSFQEVKHHGET